MRSKPYISFVVTGRNDNYGYKFFDRTQNFFDNLFFLCEKYKLNAEIIFVEWNPPKEEKKLYEVLGIKKSHYLRIRFIEVSNSIHKSIKNSDKMPLFEYIGKNVGIRRAKGKFILVTNPDIIFSEDMIRFLSKKNLKENEFYRTDRLDLHIDLPENLPPESVETFCRKNWKSCWSVKWGRYNRGIKKIKEIKRLFMRTVAKYIPTYSYLKYHGGGPGDFMILSKESWIKIRGFPELEFHSGMDGYGCILAVSSGLKFIILNEKTYHQTHGRPVDDRPLYSMKEYIIDAKKMLKEKKPIVYNNKVWGLGNFKLNEKSFN